jgi:carbon catabolite-derepressing protein kinase
MFNSSQIRQNPWFNIGLPDYLKPLPESEESPFAEIDSNMVTELHKVFICLCLLVRLI